MSDWLFAVHAPDGIDDAALATFEDTEIGRGTTVRHVTHGAANNNILVVDALNAKAQHIVRGACVKVYRTALSTTVPQTFFFVDKIETKVVSEAADYKVLAASGTGTLWHLANAVLLDEPYTTAPIPRPDLRGGLEVDGMWVWGADENGQRMGAICRRAYEEGRDQPSSVVDSPFYAVDADFNRTVDSNGVAWPAEGERYEKPIGTSVLEVFQDAVASGLYAQMTGKSGGRLNLSVYQSMGTDRSGSVFGSGAVRFVNLPNDADNNIATDLTRQENDRQVSDLLVAGDEFVYERAGDAGANMPRWETISFPSNDPSLLQLVAERNLHARNLAIDAIRFPLARVGDDEANGVYYISPEAIGGHAWMNDTVTVHTGATSRDLSEADFPLAAWELRMEDDWEEWVEVGHVMIDSQRRAFEQAVTSIRHTLELCRPMGSSVTPDIGATAVNSSSFSTSIVGLYVDPAWDDVVLYVDIMAVGGAIDDIQPTWNPAAGSTAGPHAFTLVAASGTDPRLQRWRLVNPPASTSLNSYIHIAMTSVTLINYGVWAVTGVDQAAPERATVTNSGTGSTSSVTVGAQAGDLVLDSAAYTAGSHLTVDPVPASQNVEDWVQLGNVVSAHIGMGGSHGDATPAWDFGASYSWRAIASAIQGSGNPSSVAAGDGHRDLIGSSLRASRCDHRHDVHRAVAPTVDDDTAAGYRLGTIWARLDSLTTPTEIIGVWMLVDATEGAAVWAEWPGGDTGPHDHGLDDLTDVDLTGAADGDFLKRDGGIWVPDTFAGLSNPMTTAGDIIKGGSSGTPERLGIGSAGQVLKVVSGAPAWAAESGGGSGGLDLVVDVDGSSFAGFTAHAGTWASDAGVIKQTNGAAAVYRTRYDTRVPTSHMICQVEALFASGGVGARSAGINLGWPGTNVANYPFMHLVRDTTNKFQVGQDALNNVLDETVTLVDDTWYTITARVSGYRVDGYLDGAFKGSVNFGGNASTISVNYLSHFVGLRAFDGPVWFRNFKVWVLTLPS